MTEEKKQEIPFPEITRRIEISFPVVTGIFDQNEKIGENTFGYFITVAEAEEFLRLKKTAESVEEAIYDFLLQIYKLTGEGVASITVSKKLHEIIVRSVSRRFPDEKMALGMYGPRGYVQIKCQIEPKVFSVTDIETIEK